MLTIGAITPPPKASSAQNGRLSKSNRRLLVAQRSGEPLPDVMRTPAVKRAEDLEVLQTTSAGCSVGPS
jgi:hypothetical protein